MMKSFEEIVSIYNKTIREDFVGFLEKKYNFIDMLKNEGYRERVAVDFEKVDIKDLLMSLGLCSKLEVYVGGELFRCMIISTGEEERKFALYDFAKDKRVEIEDAMFVYIEI